MRSGFWAAARPAPLRPFSAASGSKPSKRKMVVRLRRISGSSSMMRIFFMLGNAFYSRPGSFSFLAATRIQRSGTRRKNRQPHRHGGSFSQRALHGNPSAVQFHAPFDDGETQTGARPLAHVPTATKSFK